MKRVTLPALVLVATALPAAAQAPDRDWRRVQKLEPGREIAVTLDDAPSALRLFVSASDSQLTLLTASRATEAFPKAAVTEISVKEKGRGFWGHLGPLGGYFVGALAGGYASGLACNALKQGSCDTGAFLVGSVVGGLAGGGYGFHAARRETERIIYRRASLPP